MSVGSVGKKIEAANKNQRITGDEALGTIVEALKGGVSQGEHTRVVEWRAQIDRDDFQIADGTRRTLDNFIRQHERSNPPVDLETVDVAELAPIFDSIDYWYKKKEAGMVSINELPEAVLAGFKSQHEGEGLETFDNIENVFTLPVKGKTVYGVHAESNYFFVELYSAKGRLLWDLHGQVD